jgi:Nif-specific regulatory protein
LNVVPIFLPPLRERQEDVALLLQHFLELYNRENRTKYHLAPEAMARLVSYPWPGNVRELENAVERMCVMAKGDLLGVEDVPLPLALNAVRAASSGASSAPSGTSASLVLDGTLDDLEKKRVTEVMERCGWVQARACKVLGITPRQLGYKLKKYKIGYKHTNL